MAALRTGLKEVERELEFHRSQTQPAANNAPADRFLPVMKEFLSSATCRFSELEDLFQDMKTRVCSYSHLTPNKERKNHSYKLFLKIPQLKYHFLYKNMSRPETYFCIKLETIETHDLFLKWVSFILEKN